MEPFSNDAVAVASATVENPASLPEKEPLPSPSSLRFFSIDSSLLLLFFYVASVHWNLANYVGWVRFHGSLLQNAVPPALYLVFVIVAMVAFWTVVGPALLFSGIYLRSSALEGRKRRWLFQVFGIGVAFVVIDVPLVALDVSIFVHFGWAAVLPAVSFVLRMISFLIGALMALGLYVHVMAEGAHRWMGSTEELREAMVLQAQMKQEKAFRRQSTVVKRQMDSELAGKGTNELSGRGGS